MNKTLKQNNINFYQLSFISAKKASRVFIFQFLKLCLYVFTKYEKMAALRMKKRGKSGERK